MYKWYYLPYLDWDIKTLMNIDKFLGKLEIVWMVKSWFSDCGKLYVNIVNVEEFLVAEILDGVGWSNFLFDLVD